MGGVYDGTRLVGVDERGNRVGEDHPRAHLSNDEVELIRELANPSDNARPLSQRTIAEKFGISRGTVSDIVRFRRRASYPVGWRRVSVMVEGSEVIPGRVCDAWRQPVIFDPPDNDVHA